MRKFCRGCDTLKPDTDFNRDNRSSDGLKWRCKECSREARTPVTPRFLGKKQCTKCSEIYPITEFGIDRYARDGRQSRCKKCRNLLRRTIHMEPVNISPKEARTALERVRKRIESLKHREESLLKTISELQNTH